MQEKPRNDPQLLYTPLGGSRGDPEYKYPKDREKDGFEKTLPGEGIQHSYHASPEFDVVMGQSPCRRCGRREIGRTGKDCPVMLQKVPISRGGRNPDVEGVTGILLRFQVDDLEVKHADRIDKEHNEAQTGHGEATQEQPQVLHIFTVLQDVFAVEAQDFPRKGADYRPQKHAQRKRKACAKPSEKFVAGLSLRLVFPAAM